MMLFTILILSSFLGLYYRYSIYKLLLGLFLRTLKTYLWISDTVLHVLPKFIFIKSYIHKNSDIDFSVYEYYYNYKGRFHKFKMVDSLEYNMNEYFDNVKIDNIYDIHHACVLNYNREYIKDVTIDIRHFMHLKNIIEWKYILLHLGIERNDILVVHKNDEDFTEVDLHIKDIYNEKFNF